MKAEWSSGITFNEAMGAGSSPRLHRFIGKGAYVENNYQRARDAAIAEAKAMAVAEFPSLEIPAPDAQGNGMVLHAGGYVSATLVVVTD